MRGIELRDVCPGETLLLIVLVEDDGAILGADVAVLPVELRGIVRHREEDAQELSIADLCGVIDDAHALGIVRFVFWRGCYIIRTHGKAGLRGFDTFETFKDSLRSP